MIPIGNAQADAISSTVLVDRDEQMAIYDSLPESWRKLINSLPTPQELSIVQRFLERFGEAEGRKRIVETFKVTYPGWNEDLP